MFAVISPYTSEMGGERASRTRQREAGKICAVCDRPLDAPPWPGERRCDQCAINQPRHRVLLQFMRRHDIWHVSFLEADCKTSLPRKLGFSTPERIFHLAERGGAEFGECVRADMQRGIETGRGTIWLNLAADQYRKLL